MMLDTLNVIVSDTPAPTVGEAAAGQATTATITIA